MLRFYILRASKELFGHFILIFLPILLISFFYYVNSGNAIIDRAELSTVLTIGFALTFQIYGSAISFETLGHDFLSPIHDRLLAAPIHPRQKDLQVFLRRHFFIWAKNFLLLTKS
jgi:ABC-2 type transport system permease protein